MRKKLRNCSKRWKVRRSYASVFPDHICFSKVKGTLNLFEVIAVECAMDGVLPAKKKVKALDWYVEMEIPIYLAFLSTYRKRDRDKFGDNAILLKRLHPAYPVGVEPNDKVIALG